MTKISFEKWGHGSTRFGVKYFNNRNDAFAYCDVLIKIGADPIWENIGLEAQE